MAELATLARPYARGAFAVAKAGGDESMTHWLNMLQLFAAAVQVRAFAEALGAPDLSRSEVVRLLMQVAGEGADEQVQNFLHLLARNKRLLLLPQVAAQYELLRAEHQQVLEVEVVSAQELGDSVLAAFSQRLAERFGRKVHLRTRIEPGVLGGAVVRTGDAVIDGSVRGRLETLASWLRTSQAS